jgi:hypothetical protein
MNTINNLAVNTPSQIKTLQQSGNTDTATLNFANALNAAQEAAQGLQTSSASAEIPSPASTTTQTTSKGRPHLLAVGSSDIHVGKPNIKEFMDATGSDFQTARDVLYGTIGSNTDLRDWQAIMASSTPLADARASTAAMYDQTGSTSTEKYKPDTSKVLAQSGHLAIVDVTSNEPNAKPTESFILTDGMGNQLTSFGNADDFLARSANFGFDGNRELSALTEKVSQSNELNIPPANADPATQLDFILSVMLEQLKQRHSS